MEQMTCKHCGANLSAEDMSARACRYCGTVFEHYARAAEKVAVVQELLRPGPGGIPMGMQGMVGGIPGAVPPSPYAPPPQFGQPPVITSGSAVTFGGPAPPMGGAPVGFGYPQAYDPNQIVKRVQWITIISVVGGLVLTLAILGVVAAAFIFAR